MATSTLGFEPVDLAVQIRTPIPLRVVLNGIGCGILIFGVSRTASQRRWLETLAPLLILILGVWRMGEALLQSQASKQFALPQRRAPLITPIAIAIPMPIGLQ